MMGVGAGHFPRKTREGIRGDCPVNLCASLCQHPHKCVCLCGLVLRGLPFAHMKPASSKTEKRDPVITGLGASCAAGASVSELWASYMLGDSPVPAIRAFSAATPLPGEKGRRLSRKADRTGIFALAAAQQAWDCALPSGLAPHRIGIFLGSSRGPVSVSRNPPESRTARIRPSAVAMSSPSAAAGLVASLLGISGPAMTIAASCISSGAALHTAAAMIASGRIDAALVGGVEAPLAEPLLREFSAAGVLSAAGALKPFDRHRTGTLLGEGAAFLFLEAPEIAERRGASVRAVVRGTSAVTDPGVRTSMDSNGSALQRAIQGALDEAEMTASDIGLIHLHGTGTRMNDDSEAAAIRGRFGDVEAQPSCTASKGVMGHTLGASTAFQIILSILSMESGIIPAIAGCEEPDVALRLVLGSPLPLCASTALCTTSGFWGNHCAVVLGRP